MVTKTLKKKEVELGFVHIPAKNRAELLGKLEAPFETKLNDLPAKVDKYGRIWSDYLRQRYSIDTEVSISRDGSGFTLSVLENGQASIAPNNNKHPLDIPHIQTVVSSENIARTKDIAISDNIKNIVAKPPENRILAVGAKSYFQADSVYILNDDILKTEALEKNSVDLIVTSPPYCVDINYENYDDGIPYGQYLSFSKNWLRKCYDISKDDGRLCLNIPWTKTKVANKVFMQT